jgi:hypothetical protein
LIIFTALVRYLPSSECIAGNPIGFQRLVNANSTKGITNRITGFEINFTVVALLGTERSILKQLWFLPNHL